MNKLELIKNITFTPDFELKLANNVFWIPYNMNVNNALPINDLTKLITLTPEQKKEKINTIIDAVNLFILSNFDEYNDNIIIEENEIVWEYHKPGYISVLSNKGCCASCCTWANYLLADNFDEAGYINIIRSIKSGHVVNYFKNKKNDWYYILDLQPFVELYQGFICAQTGKRIDFIKSKFITGILVKAKSIEDYVNFYSRYTSKIMPEHLYLVQTSSIVQPIGFLSTDEKRHVFIPDVPDVKVIDCVKPLKIITYQFTAPPKLIPNWY